MRRLDETALRRRPRPSRSGRSGGGARCGAAGDDGEANGAVAQRGRVGDDGLRENAGGAHSDPRGTRKLGLQAGIENGIDRSMGKAQLTRAVSPALNAHRPIGLGIVAIEVSKNTFEKLGAIR